MEKCSELQMLAIFFFFNLNSDNIALRGYSHSEPSKIGKTVCNGCSFSNLAKLDCFVKLQILCIKNVVLCPFSHFGSTRASLAPLWYFSEALPKAQF